MDVCEEVEVVPYVVVLADVLEEVGLGVRLVDYCLVDSADQAVVLEVVPALILLRPQDREIVDYNTYQNSEEDLKDDHNVDILEH